MLLNNASKKFFKKYFLKHYYYATNFRTNDSKRLAKLCGQFDENLKQIEEDLVSKSKIEEIF